MYKNGNVWEIMEYYVFDVFDILHMQHDNINCIYCMKMEMSMNSVAFLYYNY